MSLSGASQLQGVASFELLGPPLLTGGHVACSAYGEGAHFEGRDTGREASIPKHANTCAVCAHCMAAMTLGG